jgi:S-adenosylmethionine synthetase
MIRFSEMVLPGHPDKFCDQVADSIIEACMAIDDDGYAQIEVSVWSDQVWLSGGICTRRPLGKSLQDFVTETGQAIGYLPGTHIDANKYHVTDTVCQQVGDPTQWSRYVNDQSIVIGWAGYDEKTHFLPPEHFLAHVFREALGQSCRDGLLKHQGPDGKLLVRMREEGNQWFMEHLLITLQQEDSIEFMSLCQNIATVARLAYDQLQKADNRWVSQWENVELMINPNGPLIGGGSDGDNGQTGRKLVVDYYGPRIPIGGGALSGKHMGHIDRIGAYTARSAAIAAVKSGAEDCLVRAAYAPNVPDPLVVTYEMTGRGKRQQSEFFNHSAMTDRFYGTTIKTSLATGTHFYDLSLPWNN